MSKFLIGFLAVSLVLSGCVAQDGTQSAPPGETLGVDSSAEVSGTPAVTQEEINEIDSEISELESMLEDSDLTGDDFLEVDESTFE